MTASLMRNSKCKTTRNKQGPSLKTKDILKNLYRKPKDVDRRAIDKLLASPGELFLVDTNDLPFMGNMPEGLVTCVAASASRIQMTHLGPVTYIIGGLEVYRIAPDDSIKGANFNMDNYYIIDSGGKYQLCGPYRNKGHWSQQIPARVLSAKSV